MQTLILGSILATSNQEVTPVGVLLIILIITSPFIYSRIKKSKVRAKFKKLLPQISSAHKEMLASKTIQGVNHRLTAALSSEIDEYIKLSDEYTDIAIIKAIEVSVVLYYLNVQFDELINVNMFNIYLDVYNEGKMINDNERDPFFSESSLDSEDVIVEFVHDHEIIFNSPPLKLKQFIELVVDSKLFATNKLIYGGTGIVYYSNKGELELKFLERQRVYRDGFNNCLLRLCGYK